VETPLLCRYGVTDPAIESLAVGSSRADAEPRYLQSSPEFAMKRLLAAGTPSCFQICKAFRDGEQGKRHNPEFSMLEWYRLGWDYRALMDEVAELLAAVLPVRSLRSLTFQSLFMELLGIDPLALDDAALLAAARGLLAATELPAQLARADCLDLLLTHAIEPQLHGDTLWLVSDWPAAQAALAELCDDGMTARRFEVYWRGVELANGYQELRDAGEQAQRHALDNAARRSRGMAPRTPDPLLAAALRAGLPACSGVAMGLDRLLMLQLDTESLDAVLSFSWDRC
jgi:elongation factor P--(R)-beta-lysine ligase